MSIQELPSDAVAPLTRIPPPTCWGYWVEDHFRVRISNSSFVFRLESRFCSWCLVSSRSSVLSRKRDSVTASTSHLNRWSLTWKRLLRPLGDCSQDISHLSLSNSKVLVTVNSLGSSSLRFSWLQSPSYVQLSSIQFSRSLSNVQRIYILIKKMDVSTRYATKGISSPRRRLEPWSFFQ